MGNVERIVEQEFLAGPDEPFGVDLEPRPIPSVTQFSASGALQWS
jgi:hypothetical protein